MFKGVVLALGLALSAPVPGMAQDATTLADIKAELTQLYVTVQSLRSELTTSGALTQGVAGSTPLERLDAMERELQRLTSKSEELQNRINRITTDGTNRIGDLEFRICELEEGCDTSALGETPTLGGVDNGVAVPTPQQTPTQTPQLAIGEEADFARAQEALAASDFRGAADLFATYTQTYPGGALNPKAHYLRGEALESLGEMTEAARAYLASFSASQTGEVAPDALFKLGYSLSVLGQTQDACITLAEVGTRFPGAPATLEAQSTMRNIGCN